MQHLVVNWTKTTSTTFILIKNNNNSNNICINKRSLWWFQVKLLNHMKVLGKSKNSMRCTSWTVWTCSPHQSGAGELHSLTHSRESINSVPRCLSLSASGALHNSALDMLWRPNEHLQQVTGCIRCIKVRPSHVWKKIRSKVTLPRGVRCHLGGGRIQSLRVS